MTSSNPNSLGPSAEGQGGLHPEAGAFLERLYALRWVLSLAALAGIALALYVGATRIARLGAAVSSFGDTTNGRGAAPPPVFDPRMQIWFGEADAAVASFSAIEDRFVAEDFVMVAFQEMEEPLGVFSEKSMGTVARLTAAFERIPGVRHVRSLTSNPWIRWAEIEDGEEGLVISDLVAGDPAEMTEAERIERMVAVVGGKRAVAMIGLGKFLDVMGPDADPAEFIGEPRLLGTIVGEDARTSVIQVQVLRPVPDAALAAAAKASDPGFGGIAPGLFSIQAQRAALRGIEHSLRVEMGRSVMTDRFYSLVGEVEAMADAEERNEWRRRLNDPTRAFVVGPRGANVRKWLDYDPDGDGGWVDRAESGAAVTAPSDFQPKPLSDYAFHLGGIPIFELNFETVGMADAKYMGAMFLIIVLLLVAVFRSVAGVVAPMAVVLGSVGAMVGIAFSLGFLFNNLTMISPNMLTAVGIADAIHLVASWMVIRGSAATKRDAILEALRRNALPVLLTSVTTAIGFFSLTVSGLAPVRMLGIMAGLGALVALVLSLTLVPAILSLIPHGERGERGGRGAAGAGLFNLARSRRLVAWIGRVERPILGVSVVLAAVALVGVARVRIDSDFRAMFPKGNDVMEDFAWIEDRIGGVGDLEIVFDGTRGTMRPDGLDRASRERFTGLLIRATAAASGGEHELLSEAEIRELSDLRDRDIAYQSGRIGVDAHFLRTIDRFEARLREEMADPSSAMAAVTDLVSPLDVLRKMHQVQNQNQSQFYRTPGEEDVADGARAASVEFDEWTEEWSYTPPQSASSLIAQYYLQYENGAEPSENLATELSQDRTQFRMQGRVIQAPSDVQNAAFARIEEIARTEFPILGARVDGRVPDGARAAMTVSGKTLLFARTTKVFAIGFIQSMSLALVLITLIIGVLFRSWRLALTSIVPNVLPILIPLSVFGLLGMTLDGPAILVSSVALGVCVDDTIHVFTKFVRARKRGLDAEEALAHVFQEAGAAVTLTTVVLVIGFATLILSDFAPNVLMGSLAGAMIALAWLADMLVVPVLLSRIARAEDGVAEITGGAGGAACDAP